MSYTSKQINSVIDYVIQHLACSDKQAEWVRRQLQHVIKKIIARSPDKVYLKMGSVAFEDFFAALANKKISFPPKLNILFKRDGKVFDLSSGASITIYQPEAKVSSLNMVVYQLKQSLKEYEIEKMDKEQEDLRQHLALLAVTDNECDERKHDDELDYEADSDVEILSDPWDQDLSRMQYLTFLFDGKDGIEPERVAQPEVATRKHNTTNKKR
jgi:hypothetical protein